MRGLNRYIIGLLLATGLVILIIVLATGKTNKSTTPKNPFPDAYLSSNSSVELYVRGPINNVATHNEMSIDVSSSAITMNIYQGYNGDIIKSKSYPNTQEAYNTFLRALNTQFYARGSVDPKNHNPAGYCPFNQLYYFRTYQDGNRTQNYWEVSCSGYPTTFSGNSSAIISLYQAQVPNYSDLLANTNINP